MSTARKVMDAINLDTGEKIYFNSHAAVTYMGDGRNVETVITDAKNNLKKLNIGMVNATGSVDEAKTYVTSREFNEFVDHINDLLNQIEEILNE